jgi:hypothetical protein
MGEYRNRSAIWYSNFRDCVSDESDKLRTWRGRIRHKSGCQRFPTAFKMENMIQAESFIDRVSNSDRKIQLFFYVIGRRIFYHITISAYLQSFDLNKIDINGISAEIMLEASINCRA